jgi:hypothetical protein
MRVEAAAIAGAIARLRKIADELESGKITPMSCDRFKSAVSPSYLDNHLEIMDDESVVVTIGWMERIE